MAEAGAAHRLSPSDSLLWRMEADPVLRAPILVVGTLDREPDPARLGAAVERAARAVPGLRQRLAPPPLGVGLPTWRTVEQLSLDHHVRRVRSRAGGLRAVLDLTEPDATAPFDPERPPWTLTVVDGLDGGGAALVLRFHHAITDGVGALRLAHVLFDRTRRRPAAAVGGPTAPERDPAVGHGRHEPLAARLARDASALAGTVSGAVAAAARDPAAAAARSVRLAASLSRLLRPAPPVGSRLIAGRGLDRALHAFEVPLADVRRAARAAGGTVNDVLLAAVGGGVRAYHDRHGVPLRALRVSMPVDRRRDGDPAGGNRFAPTRFVLPVDEPNPVTRTRIAGAIARSVRAEPGLAATSAVAAGLSLMPAPAVSRIFGGLLRGVDVNVVDLRGLDGPVYLAGARVDRLWAFAPAVGTACSVTLLSHAGAGCVAATIDRAAVADPELLVSCLEAGFREVLAGTSVASA